MHYSASDYRRMGRDSLKDCWGVALISLLINAAITGVLSSTGIGTIIVAGPLAVGLATVFLAISRYRQASYETVFAGFKTNFVENLVANLLAGIFIFLWSLLLIIPGIIKAYAYFMVPYILADNPQMKAMDAIRESERIMNGHKMDLFLLHLSFIGWMLLSFLTCGLLLLYVVPYMQAANAAFYRVLVEGEQSSQTDWQSGHDFTNPDGNPQA